MLAFTTSLFIRAASRRLVSRSVHAEKRLADLGLDYVVRPKPAGSYALTSRVGNMMFLSGHLPFPSDGNLITGKVGLDLDTKAANEAAKWVGINLITTLKSEVEDLDKIKIHKLVGFVNCVDGYTEQPTVVNGCSDLMLAVFGESFIQAGRHARSAVGTNALPLNVPVEIEAIVEILDE